MFPIQIGHLGHRCGFQFSSGRRNAHMNPALVLDKYAPITECTQPLTVPLCIEDTSLNTVSNNLRVFAVIENDYTPASIVMLGCNGNTYMERFQFWATELCIPFVFKAYLNTILTTTLIKHNAVYDIAFV